jgi:hypothetical protein
MRRLGLRSKEIQNKKPDAAGRIRRHYGSLSPDLFSSYASLPASFGNEIVLTYYSATVFSYSLLGWLCGEGLRGRLREFIPMIFCALKLIIFMNRLIHLVHFPGLQTSPWPLKLTFVASSILSFAWTIMLMLYVRDQPKFKSLLDRTV